MIKQHKNVKFMFTNGIVSLFPKIFFLKSLMVDFY